MNSFDRENLVKTMALWHLGADSVNVSRLHSSSSVEIVPAPRTSTSDPNAVGAKPPDVVNQGNVTASQGDVVVKDSEAKEAVKLDNPDVAQKKEEEPILQEDTEDEIREIFPEFLPYYPVPGSHAGAPKTFTEDPVCFDVQV